MASYKGRALGAIGDIGAYSFHETKNLISGEGGALLMRDTALAQRAEVIREKGTDRSRYFRGEVDKYTWQDVGSSFLPGELTAAFLWAQLEEAERITQDRLRSWARYHAALESLEESGAIRRAIIPDDCQHNAHMYYVLLHPQADRQRVLQTLRAEGIGSVFHYVPLHDSPAGKRYGRAEGELAITQRQSRRMLRLPLWTGLSETQQDRVVDVFARALG